MTSAAPNLVEYSVSDLANALKRTVEDSFGLVRVRGEISGFKRATSGHCYLALKDADAVIDGVMWRNTAGRLSFRPEDGLEVVATGRLTTYPGRSKYQIVIEAMEPAGAGALMALLEERRKKLAAEGLFDATRKKKIPYLPGVIGVVTSPTGAVIRDILHRLADRFPRHVLVWPVAVQGEGAAAQVAAAIAGFNALPVNGPTPRPDVIIVARGGGSIEDLWAFNEEVVVRAAAGSAIPLISAVGHETDTTLIDFASDLRAPTPTAAAEMAVPVRSELLTNIRDLERRATMGLKRTMAERRTRLTAAGRALPKLTELIALPRQRLDSAGERLPRALMTRMVTARAALDVLAARHRPEPLRRRIADQVTGLTDRGQRLRLAVTRLIQDAGSRLTREGRMLESLSYRSVLARGFVLVTGDDGHTISTAAAATPGRAVFLDFADGRAAARIEGDGPAETGTADASPKTRRPRKGPAGQSSLFE